MSYSAETFAELAAQVGSQTGTAPWEILGHVEKESTFNPKATSGFGRYVGLMQIDKGLVQKMFPGKNPLDPAVNMLAGITYLNQLARQFGGSRELALAAYNWGPGNLKKLLKKQGANSYAQIQNRLPSSVRFYVTKIAANAAKYRAWWG